MASEDGGPAFPVVWQDVPHANGPPPASAAVTVAQKQDLIATVARVLQEMVAEAKRAGMEEAAGIARGVRFDDMGELVDGPTQDTIIDAICAAAKEIKA